MLSLDLRNQARRSWFFDGAATMPPVSGRLSDQQPVRVARSLLIQVVNGSLRGAKAPSP